MNTSSIALPPLVSLLRRWAVVEPSICSESFHLWSIRVGIESVAVYHDPQSVHDRGVILMAVTSAIKAKGWEIDLQYQSVPNKYQISTFSPNDDSLPWGNGEDTDLIVAALSAYLEAVEVLIAQQQEAAA